MKKLMIMVAASFLMLQTVKADRDIVTTDTNKLPVQAREFVSKYFPGVTISHIKIDKNWIGGDVYDVILTNGFDLEFDKSGDWTEVDGERAAIPQSFMSPVIINYVVKNFPKEKIVRVERKKRMTEVKLSNGLEVLFDRSNNFAGYSD